MYNAGNEGCLKQYIKDIKKTEPYSKQEEQELFRLLKKGNREARDKLTNANMRFVLKVAFQYKKSSLPLADLISEGGIGLVRAVESFDSSRGLKFISYAVWWIRAYITRAINDYGSTIRLPTNQNLKIRKALKERTLDGDIKELIRRVETNSLDDKIGPDTDKTFYEFVGKPDPLYAELSETERFVPKILEELPEREAEILKSLYGIDYRTPQTLRQVAESQNLSRERVRQIRDQALGRIKKSKFNGTTRKMLEQSIEAEESILAYQP